MTWYRMFDPEPNGVFPMASSEAQSWNSKLFGIFATINEFSGPRRIENLKRIRSWAIDIDQGTKENQRERIKKSPLIPSVIVETKNGYHVHWYADLASSNTWKLIVQDRLVPFFGADNNAKDIARILRVPGYMHCKDPHDPFPVRAVWRASHARYTEKQMIRAFPEPEEKTAQRTQHRASQRHAESAGISHGDDFWDAVYNLDCEEGLRRLSGTSAVFGEEYSFRPTRDGKRNIIVDGRSTSCWIDSSDRIGSADGGGPTLIQWILWFDGKSKSKESYRRAIEVLKEIFPQLENTK